MAIKCPYCYGMAELLQDSTPLYSRDYGPVWICHPCQSWVGCHRGTIVPLGRLANKELRNLKRLAHREFDPIWERNYTDRSSAYGALAEYLGIKKKQCHIGYMDEEMCRKVIEACKVLGPKFRDLSKKRR